jgi:5-methylcytosine-specific restriction protein A
MPSKALKPCAYRGCPELTDKIYCSVHAKEEMKHYNRYERDPLTVKRYDSHWKKIRAAYLTTHPCCENVSEHKTLTPATLVHHRLPLKLGGTHDVSNLMALCVNCHERIHSERKERF